MGWRVDVVNESSESKRKAGFERHFEMAWHGHGHGHGHNEQRSEQTETIGAIILYHHQRVAE